MPAYYYAVASEKFLLEEEPLDEILKERRRHYQEQEQELDFWLVRSPAFLAAPELAMVKANCPQPAVALVSTNKTFITWLKLRFEYVATGEFHAPSATIPDPLASLNAVSP
ncbi:MAG: MgPME-cyclase complex family protein [Nodosilinea sp.]